MSDEDDIPPYRPHPPDGFDARDLRLLARRAESLRKALDGLNQPPPFNEVRLRAYLDLLAAAEEPSDALVVRDALRDARFAVRSAHDENLGTDLVPEVNQLDLAISALLGELREILEPFGGQALVPALPGPKAAPSSLLTRSISKLSKRIARVFRRPEQFSPSIKEDGASSRKSPRPEPEIEPAPLPAPPPIGDVGSNGSASHPPPRPQEPEPQTKEAGEIRDGELRPLFRVHPAWPNGTEAVDKSGSRTPDISFVETEPEPEPEPEPAPEPKPPPPAGAPEPEPDWIAERRKAIPSLSVIFNHDRRLGEIIEGQISKKPEINTSDWLIAMAEYIDDTIDSETQFPLPNPNPYNRRRKDIAIERLAKSAFGLPLADLRRVNMRGANLRRANLRGANLRGANLSNANLKGAHLENSNLIGAHLEGVNLTDAHLHNAKLRRARLEGANLEYASLREANLSRAHLMYANLGGTDLARSNLRGANLRSANVGRAQLWSADLRDSNLWGANLDHANLENADLEHANLENADLEHATLVNANLENAHLKGALFSGCPEALVDGWIYD